MYLCITEFDLITYILQNHPKPCARKSKYTLIYSTLFISINKKFEKNNWKIRQMLSAVTHIYWNFDKLNVFTKVINILICKYVRCNLT